MTLFYLPLEPYVERYTYFMSAPNGWAEANFRDLGIPFVRVEGERLGNTINAGKVLDACGRSVYATTQIANLVKLINAGSVHDGDVIYVEDFWHPGIESLFYIRHLLGIDFKIGTFLHAQSVDDSDFTFDMRYWMRPIEVGYGRGYDYIFVTSEILKRLLVDATIGDETKIHNVGLPYNSKRLQEQLVDMNYKAEAAIVKEDYVIFSSRFDDEKDPMFFLDLVERCPDIQFKLVRPRKVLTANEEVMRRTLRMAARHGSNLVLLDTSSKLSYYYALAHARVQFNCAIQDWVSWTLLEAVTFKCLPLYPKWKDFPVELNNDEKYLYNRQDLDDAAFKLRRLMHTKSFDYTLDKIVRKHDNSWTEYLRRMNFNV